MKALVKAHAEKGIWMQDIPEPTVGVVIPPKKAST